MDIKPILGAGVGLQATSLAMHMYPKKKKKKGQLFGNFATAMVGIPLLSAQSEMINKL